MIYRYNQIYSAPITCTLSFTIQDKSLAECLTKHVAPIRMLARSHQHAYMFEVGVHFVVCHGNIIIIRCTMTEDRITGQVPQPRIHYRCHGLRVYPVCVCNTVRLGQVRSRHNLKPSGTRFARVSGLRV